MSTPFTTARSKRSTASSRATGRRRGPLRPPPVHAVPVVLDTLLHDQVRIDFRAADVAPVPSHHQTPLASSSTGGAAAQGRPLFTHIAKDIQLGYAGELSSDGAWISYTILRDRQAPPARRTLGALLTQAKRTTEGFELSVAFTGASWGEAADTAYHKILDMLLHNEVPDGGRLRENHLAELTGVSRTPVRQALNRLAAEGVVSLSRNRGAQVLELSSEDARGLLDLRARFEPYATRLAVERISSQNLQDLESLAGEMEKLVESSSWEPVTLSRLNNQFHAVIIDNCGNRHLQMALQSVVMPAMVARTFDRYTPEALSRSMRHHVEVIDAARARDGEWAESVMRTHILAARHAFPNSDSDRSSAASSAD